MCPISADGLQVTVRVVRLKDTQPVADGQPWSHDKESARESLTVGMALGIDRLPHDQHRHYSGLAGACRHLQCETHDLRVGFFVGVGKMVEQSTPRTPMLGATTVSQIATSTASI